MLKNHTRLDLVEGGNIIKQGDQITLAFYARDYKGEILDLTDKTIAGQIYSRQRGIVYEAAASYDAATQKIFFTITKLLDTGSFQIEFTITNAGDADYRLKVPSDSSDGRLTINASGDNMDYVGVSMTTVSQLRNEQQALQTEFANEVLPRVNTVEGRQDELEEIVQAGVGAFTEDTEVVTARMGEPSLLAYNQKTTALLAETVKNTIYTTNKKYGIVADGITDDTAGFQKVINDALASNQDIMLLGSIRINGSIVINRDSGIRKIIQIKGQGELIKHTAGYMFSVGITDRNAGNIRFTGIKFRSTAGAGTVIYDASKLIRMYFGDCDFLNVDSVANIPDGTPSPNHYIQTLYMSDCAVVGGKGYFVKAPVMYDVSFAHSIMEHRESAFYCINFHSLRIVDSLIEGIEGHVFYGTDGYKLVISHNYFEECMTSNADTCFIRLFETDPTDASVTIQDNFISGTATQQSNNNFYFVSAAVVLKSMKVGGNSSNINLYNVAQVYSINKDFITDTFKDRVIGVGRVKIKGFPVMDNIQGSGNLLSGMKKPFDTNFISKYLTVIADNPANVVVARAGTGQFLYCKVTTSTAQAGFKVNKKFTLSPSVYYVPSFAGNAYTGTQPSMIVRIRDSANVVVYTYTIDTQNYFGTRSVDNFYTLPPFKVTTQGLYTIEFEFNNSAGNIPIDSALEFSYVGIQQGTIGTMNDSPIYDSSWDGNMLNLGSYNLWVDSMGKLRIKSGYPINETDGSIVGVQT